MRVDDMPRASRGDTMLTPSTSHLWTKCALTASISHGAGTGDGPFIPDAGDGDTEARREGIAADWVANGVLRGDAASAAEFLGESAPNGWMITGDLVQHVQGYVDYCRSRGEVVQTQSIINIPHLFIRGRLDSQTVQGRTLEIIELKYGWRPVEVEFNPQLLCEAIALFDPEKHDRVILTIYQPRPYHPDGKVRHWEMDEPELTTAYYWLKGKAIAATSPDPKGSVGYHCRDCDGRGRCEALARAAYSAFEWISGTAITKMDAKQLGDEAKFLDLALALVKARHSGIIAEINGRMRRNEYIPGWMWEQRLGDREFIIPLNEVEAKTGITPYKQVPMSPAELEREGADVKIIEEITTRSNAGIKLVPATQKAMARIFKRPGVAKATREPKK